MAIVLPLFLIGCYVLQTLYGPQFEQALVDGFALSPLLLRQGNFELLLTHLFLHGSWTHVLFNAVACLIFATPVIRAIGKGFGSALSFVTFFLLCGIAAGLGYCVLNMKSAVPVIGASGAIYGLIGASSRIFAFQGGSVLAPLINRRVLGSAAVWCGLNVLTAFVPYLPGAQGMVIAWQAHIMGYLFGVLVVGHWLHAFHARRFTRS